MSYIDNNLLPDEKIIFRTKKHLIIFFYPLILTIFVCYAYSYMSSNEILSKLAWIPWLVALIFWLYAGLEYSTSDFAVTNKRVIMREGFFTRHANELLLTTVSQINIDQSLFGQLLNYGNVAINAFGAFDSFTLIAQPALFQKNVNLQRDKLVS